MAADRPMRASDDDRDRVVEILREQVTQGRLTFEEFEERIGRAYTAKTWDDLRALTNDLPVQMVFPGERAAQTPANTLGPRTRDLGRYQHRQAWLLPALLCGVVALIAVGAWSLSPFMLLGLVWIAFGSCGKQRRTYACGTRPTRIIPPPGR